MNTIIGSQFKSLKPISFSTERGDQFGNVEGEVISIDKNVYKLKGLYYNFEITKTQYDMLNQY